VPLYDFRCAVCGTSFEARTGPDERPPCPECDAPGCERLMSPFAGPFTVGLRGNAARRSNDTRRVREEQRRERREQRRGETK